MGIKDNIEKQLPKESKMIDTKDILDELEHNRLGVNKKAVAVEDFKKMVQLIESLPVFEDTGEPIGFNAEVWSDITLFGEKKVRQVDISNDNGDIRVLPKENGRFAFKFYSTKAAAEAATKGGE